MKFLFIVEVEQLRSLLSTIIGCIIKIIKIYIIGFIIIIKKIIYIYFT